MANVIIETYRLIKDKSNPYGENIVHDIISIMSSEDILCSTCKSGLIVHDVKVFADDEEVVIHKNSQMLVQLPLSVCKYINYSVEL